MNEGLYFIIFTDTLENSSSNPVLPLAEISYNNGHVANDACKDCEKLEPKNKNNSEYSLKYFYIKYILINFLFIIMKSNIVLGST